MNKEQVIQLQRELQNLGLYFGDLDGIWGPISQAALDTALGAARNTLPSSVEGGYSPQGYTLAWGTKVNATFRERVLWIADALKMPEKDGASNLMACMAWETAETFRADIPNAAGSGAIGLIQFMPKTAQALGTSTEALAAMLPEGQLNYVYKYFRPYVGRLQTLSDLYMAILWPAAIGKPESYVLWTKAASPITYGQNAGLDVNKDGVITKAEAAAKVQERLTKGLQAPYVYVGA